MHRHIAFLSGVMFAPIDQVTADGYDLQFGTNVIGAAYSSQHGHRLSLRILIGHFYLTKLLLPVLISTAKTSPEGTVRVVNTSSVAHYYSTIRYDTLKDGPERRKQWTQRQYSQSKFVRHILQSPSMLRH
jgi:retinol dehydrogenase-12